MAITGITIVNLDKWPEKETGSRQSAPFKANWFSTEKLLVKEVNQAGARGTKLYTFHPEKDIRQDGWIRGDARKPSYPGVILEFEKRIRGSAQLEKLRFPCDTFQRWEDNVRAIALALEALRKIDRYGVTTGAQYAGYKALPPAEPGTQGQTPEQAALFIANSAGVPNPDVIAPTILGSLEFAESMYRLASKKLHPDKGGSQESFTKLEGSMSLVRKHLEGKP